MSEKILNELMSIEVDQLLESIKEYIFIKGDYGFTWTRWYEEDGTLIDYDSFDPLNKWLHLSYLYALCDIRDYPRLKYAVALGIDESVKYETTDNKTRDRACLILCYLVLQHRQSCKHNRTYTKSNNHFIECSECKQSWFIDDWNFKQLSDENTRLRERLEEKDEK